jgi:hypothetical protein
MSTPQSTRSVTGHLCDAAIVLDRHRNPEVARTPLIDAVLETLGDNPQLPTIVDLLLLAMCLQRDACRDELL